ncbi:histone acetylation protein-domain-containing protein [Amanita rubescens]|nr:histone acetylation protein-domain-containing protein [Amanita rubescens]
MILRDCLLAALKDLPGTREFHIHVLVSAPRKNSSLYIFAKPLPRIYLQEILVLCSEQANRDAPRIMVTAIEAFVYHIPSTSSVVLYIAKVDTTGQGSQPSPTVALVRTLLAYYATPLTRPIPAKHLWIHLFARAQGQYLFPNSSEFAGKRALSDVKLCAWWKRVLSDVAKETQSKVAALDLYYLLPGYTESEASNALKYASKSVSSPGDVTWTYGHLYSQTDIPLPCPRSQEGKNLGWFIPSFDDDPKSRFLDDIAYNTEGEIKSPARKRARRDSYDTKEKDDKGGKNDAPLGELSKVSADEFWERMSFRQECVSGAITGFFAVGIKSVEDGEMATAVLGPGLVSPQMIKRVLASMTSGVEFSTTERAVWATETLESTIKRLCEGIGAVPTPMITTERAGTERVTPEREVSSPEAPSTPRRQGVKARRDEEVELSPGGWTEPELSLEIYSQVIYGTAAVDGRAATGGGVGAGRGGEGAVRELTARRKQRRGR